MNTKTLAHPAQNGKTPRREQGITLGQERFEEIDRVGPYLWSVPSYSGDHAYTVNFKTETCPCADRTPEGKTDKHVVAAKYKRTKTDTCSGCGARFRYKALVDVPEGDGGTFSEGELLCRPCARSHGAL